MPTGIYIRTESHKNKISIALKGRMPKNLVQLIKNKKGKKRPDMTGEKNWLWMGDKVSYRALHSWVERKMGKASKCENDKNHQSTRYHWANISKKYKRDLSDWKQLCPSCNLLDKN